MIGVINGLLFEFLEDRWGVETLDQLRAKMELPADFYFRQHRYYDDKQWQQLYSAAIELVGETREDFEWEFGAFSGERLITRHPNLVKDCKSARELIMYQPTIHNRLGEVIGDTLQRQAIAYKFRLDEDGETVIMHYGSQNQMCIFYRSLAMWAAAHYGETVTIEEVRCMRHGGAECELHLHFSRV